jgi:hypothetical protein
MKNRLKSNFAATLSRGRERFEKWRSKHKTRTRLPKSRWSAATKLAHEYGLNPTVRALRLDYNGLKKRMESSGSSQPSQAAVESKFLQLLPSELMAVAECAIEC